jgi:hypothetical protein
MKLYTEEQVKTMLIKTDKFTPLHIEHLMNEITPIELPSDEEIEQESNNEYQEQKQSYENSVEMFPIDFANYLEVGFIEGAKWMRNKIQGGNK